MAITNETPTNSYTGNAVTTGFTCNFTIFDEADVLVTVDGTTKTLTTDYTVSATSTNPFTVNFVSAPANGTAIVLKRDMAFKRDTDYQESGDLRADVLDADLDAAILMIQQVGYGFDSLDTQVASATASAAAAATSEINAAASAAAAELAAATEFLVSSYASLIAAVTALGATPCTLIVNTATTVPTNTTIPATMTLKVQQGGSIALTGNLTVNGQFDSPLITVFFGAGTVTFGAGSVPVIYPEWWGITDAVDATASIQKALDSIATIGGVVKLSSRTYTMAGLAPLFISNNNIQFIGEGSSSVLYFPSWPTTAALTASYGSSQQALINVKKSAASISNVHVAHIKIKGATDYITDANWYSPSTPCNAILFGGSATSELTINSGIEHCFFENVGGSAIGATGGSNDISTGNQVVGFYARHNYIDNTCFGGVDVFSGGLHLADVSHNTIRKTAGGGILYAGISGNIHSNNIELTMNYGIATAGVANKKTYVSVQKNNLFRCGKGVNNGTATSPSMYFGDQSTNNKVVCSSNVISQAYGPGIGVTGTTIQDITIFGNLIDGFGIDGVGKTVSVPGMGFIGIVATNGTRVMILNNTIIAGSGGSDKCDYAISCGGSGSSFTFADNNTAIGTYLTATFYLAHSLGRNGSGTGTMYGKNNLDLTTAKYATFRNNVGTVELPLTVNADTTPSVAGADVWYVANSAPTTITQFDDGYMGQRLTLFFGDGNTTISDGGSFRLNGNYTSVTGSTLSLVQAGTNAWTETSRSIN